MRPDSDPATLAPHERRREVAAIFAVGILRLHARTALLAHPDAHSSPANLPETGPDCLEVPGETVLSVQDG